MADKSININHSDAAILSNDGSYIKVGQDSAVKVGTGSSISNGNIDNLNRSILSEYAGAIRFNSTTNKLEYCTGTTWVEFVTDIDIDEKDLMIYSFLF